MADDDSGIGHHEYKDPPGRSKDKVGTFHVIFSPNRKYAFIDEWSKIWVTRCAEVFQYYLVVKEKGTHIHCLGQTHEGCEVTRDAMKAKFTTKFGDMKPWYDTDFWKPQGTWLRYWYSVHGVKYLDSDTQEKKFFHTSEVLADTLPEPLFDPTRPTGLGDWFSWVYKPNDPRLTKPAYRALPNTNAIEKICVYWVNQFQPKIPGLPVMPAGGHDVLYCIYDMMLNKVIDFVQDPRRVTWLSNATYYYMWQKIPPEAISMTKHEGGELDWRLRPVPAGARKRYRELMEIYKARGYQ